MHNINYQQNMSVRDTAVTSTGQPRLWYEIHISAKWFIWDVMKLTTNKTVGRYHSEDVASWQTGCNDHVACNEDWGMISLEASTKDQLHLHNPTWTVTFSTDAYLTLHMCELHITTKEWCPGRASYHKSMLATACWIDCKRTMQWLNMITADLLVLEPWLSSITPV